MGLLAGSLAPSMEVAGALTSVIATPLMTFNGVFVNFDSLPPGFEYLKYLSPFKYGFSILAINEYNDLDMDCMDCNPQVDNCRPCDPLDFLGLDDEEIWENFIGLFCVLLLFQISTVCVLYRESRRIRRGG